MAIAGGRLYSRSLALLIWLQNFERCISGEYNVDAPEMEFLASNLSPRECYDFYNQLSHRRGGVSIYAEKEKSRELPCRNLLMTWLTDPEESSFRSHENIELKLRKIGRKDLARWVVGKIESSLDRRRRLNDREEPQANDAIVVNRTGEKIAVPVAENRDTVIKVETITDGLGNDICVFWKIFFSVLVVLSLVVLFACCYRFFYTKLLCIFRRLDYSDHRKCRSPDKQTYGTTCASNLSERSGRESCDYLLRCSTNNQNEIDNDEYPEGQISTIATSESSEEIFENQMDQIFLRRERISSPKKSEETLRSAFPAENPKWTCCSCNAIAETPQRKSSKKQFSPIPSTSRVFENSEFNVETSGRAIDSSMEEKLEGPHDERCSEIADRTKKNQDTTPDGETDDLAGTYDELAMLFSGEMKRQWRPCRRSRCRLARRRLRSSGRAEEHDVRKCRARFGPSRFGYRSIGADERPTCGTADICRDTYDEFELMRATREEQRENVARSMVERRKRFLDQPCRSPIPMES